MPLHRNRSKASTSNATDDRWRALESRDPSATFFYSVRTTGVYCRPSCGARRARPEHVAFHETALAARQAGFRPCKRCRPDEAPAPERRAALVGDLCRCIDESDEIPSLAALAKRAKLSVFHTQRLFKATTGLTPREYAAERRAARARAGLREATSVTAAMVDAGYNSSGRFYEEADAILGMTPSRYRAGGAGEVITFATARGSLGHVLVARTTRGVCALLLGDSPKALALDLAQRFPRATLRRGDEPFARAVADAVLCIEEPQFASHLTLDVRGTSFQRRVWAALSRVPRGMTTTYSELATSLGVPKSARAVAAACAANAIAVVVPCHRVVGKSGALTGYRWGLERKRALLEREREEAHGALPATDKPATSLRPRAGASRSAKERTTSPRRRG